MPASHHPRRTSLNLAPANVGQTLVCPAHLNRLKSVLQLLLLCGAASCWLIAHPAQAQTKPVPAATPSGNPVATINGQAITAAELESGLGLQVAQLEEQIHQLKRQRLDALIADRLLEQEAAKRNLSLAALLDSEINAKVAPVTDAEIEAFYQANRHQIPANDPAIRTQIKNYLQQQRTAQRRQQFVQMLRTQAQVAVNLMPPRLRIQASSAGAPFKGGANALSAFAYNRRWPKCSPVTATR
jgi:hypothetical protein